MSLETLLHHVDARLDAHGLLAGDGLLAAFSGGGDSTALLLALSQIAPRRGLVLHAGHLDHGLDPGSATRARRAAAIAARLGVPFTCERWDGASLRGGGGEGVEAEARTARYRFLEGLRSSLGARFVATAHHRDDQVETVLLRVLEGSGLEGLAGIQPHRGRVIRPLLGLPRTLLDEAVAASGVHAVEDPTNRDLARPRNRIRHVLLPHLREELELRDRDVAAVATAASAAFRRLGRWLEGRIQPRLTPWGVEISRSALESLPAALEGPALALVHRVAGARYPATSNAREELVRQLRSKHRVGCDCGDGWRWESRGELLRLRRTRPPSPVFTYTLWVPGVVYIPEVSGGVRVRRGFVLPEMLRGSSHRAALTLSALEGKRVTIRSRRPGDRIRPSGGNRARRLKDVLYDQGVPSEERDRMPLLCIGENVVWVPGVTIDERVRAEEGAAAWIAELVARAPIRSERHDPNRR